MAKMVVMHMFVMPRISNMIYIWPNLDIQVSLSAILKFKMAVII